MKNKKGQISTSNIILLILGLTILVALIIAGSMIMLELVFGKIGVINGIVTILNRTMGTK